MRTMNAVRGKLLVLTAVGGSILSLATNTFARPGDLDLSFGKAGFNGGVRTFELTAWFHPCCLSQQLDGKLLVAGMHGGEDESSYDGRLILRRHLVTNGSLDSTFGMGGEAVASGPYPASFVWGRPHAIAVQPDGKILVAGKRADGKPVLWRFTTAGQLDPAFGDEGIQSLSTLEGSATGVILYNGKILVIESLSSGGSYLLRRTMNGAPDSTFGLFGIVTLSAAGARSLSVDPSDGAMYVAFGAYAYEGFVSRFFANGAVDATFGSGGTVTIPFSQCSAGFNTLSEVEVQADGKILVAGHSVEPPYLPGPYVFRYSGAGQPDSAFGVAGRLCLTFDSYAFYNLPRIARQADGKIVAIAYDTAYPSLKRLNADSSTDTTFRPTYTTDGHSYDVLVQTGDGKVVVLATPVANEPQAYKLIRFLP